MQFTYKTIDSSGNTQEGTIEATSSSELAKRFKKEGKTLVSATPAGEKKGFSLKSVTVFERVKMEEKINFARNLSAMADAGLPISRGLSVMERQTKNQKLKKIFADLGNAVQKGTALSSALGTFPKIFPPLFVAMVRAGEESGKLSEALRVIASQMEQSYKLKRRVRGAMMYPSIVISAMILVGILMMMFVVPTLTDTFKELAIDLPISTRVIIGISDFLSNNAILSLAALLGLIVLAILGLRTPRGKRMRDWVFLHMPIIKSLVQQLNAARTARTLSSLIAAGVEIVTALGITREVLQNSYYKDVLGEAEKSIQKGGSIAQAFVAHEELYPTLVGEMASVGEETGKLSELLLRVAVFYEEQVEERTKNLSTIIEPLLMVVVGGAAGFFAIAMLSPTYSLVGGL